MKERNEKQQFFQRFFVDLLPEGFSFPSLPLAFSTEEFYGPKESLAAFPLLGQEVIILHWNCCKHHLTLTMQPCTLPLREDQTAIIPTLYDQIFFYELLHFKKETLICHIERSLSHRNMTGKTPLISLKDLSLPMVPISLQQDFRYWLTHKKSLQSFL